MSFYLLPNVAGYYGDPNTNCGLTLATATGYSINDIISGPRSTMHRSTDSTNEVGRGYEYPVTVNVAYMVIARADLLVTQNGTRVRPLQRTSGDAWSYIAGVDYAPLTAGQLLGPRSQDLVFAVSPSDLYGVGVSTKPTSGSQATSLSKVYGCEAFDFGEPPALAPSWTDLPPNTFATTIGGTMPYEIERRFAMRFGPVTRTIATSFYSAKYMFRYWPLFLYDTSGDIWPHKLEHVIIENWTETIIENNRHVFDISFARLKHYP